MQDGSPKTLKHTDYVLIATQEELNLLAEVVEGVEVDALHIDEPYVSFIEEVPIVMPLSQIDKTHKFYGVKPRKFSSWYRRETS